MRLITRFYGMYTTSDLLNVHAAELSEVVGSQNTEMLSWKFAFSESCNVQNVFLSTVISHDDGPVCIIHRHSGSTAH